MTYRSCRPCRFGDHDRCRGAVFNDETHRLDDCACWDTHDYETPDDPLPDPYHTDAAEDAYLDNLIGERWT